MKEVTSPICNQQAIFLEHISIEPVENSHVKDTTNINDEGEQSSPTREKQYHELAPKGVLITPARQSRRLE